VRAACRVEKGLADAEVVRVTMHIGHRPTEIDHLLAQHEEEILVAISCCHGLGQRLWIA
jgi:hypothetical protein